MKQSADPFDPSQLRLTRDLVRLRIDPGETHVQIRRGVWLPRSAAAALDAGARHAAFVHATALIADADPPHTFCLASAGAVWGLPRIGAWPTHCDVLVQARRRGSELIRTHRGELVEAVLVHGVHVTPVDRTVVDLARTESLETAVVAADHALREDMCTIDELRGLVENIPKRGRGRSRAQLVVDMADPASMSVGESLSRVRMFQLNLPRPRLQVAHSDDRGLIGVVDFDWNGVIGEFDGKLKYAIPDGTDPAEAAEIVWREKQREDRLRRLENKVARWVWADALVPARMAAILAKEGIRPQARNAWFDVGSAGAPRSA